MVHLPKSTKDFKLFGGFNPGTEDSEDGVILARYAVLGPATAEFRFNKWFFRKSQGLAAVNRVRHNRSLRLLSDAHSG